MKLVVLFVVMFSIKALLPVHCLRLSGRRRVASFVGSCSSVHNNDAIAKPKHYSPSLRLSISTTIASSDMKTNSQSISALRMASSDDDNDESMGNENDTTNSKINRGYQATRRPFTASPWENPRSLVGSLLEKTTSRAMHTLSTNTNADSPNNNFVTPSSKSKGKGEEDTYNTSSPNNYPTHVQTVLDATIVRSFATLKWGSITEVIQSENDANTEKDDCYVPSALVPPDDPTHTMDDKLKTLIAQRLSDREAFRKKRDYGMADTIRGELMEKYSVVVDDMTREWKVVSESTNYNKDSSAEDSLMSENDANNNKKNVSHHREANKTNVSNKKKKTMPNFTAVPKKSQPQPPQDKRGRYWTLNTANTNQHDYNKETYLGNPSVTPTALAHSLWKSTIIPYQDTVIDATCGNGKDCLALANMLFPEADDDDDSGTSVEEKAEAGPNKPHLIGIDIQIEAVHNTVRSLLVALPAEFYRKHVSVLEQSHEHLMNVPSDKSSVGLVCYNLGYLPGKPPTDEVGGEYKRCQTQTETTLHSITDASLLLRVGGLLSIMAYPGSNLEESRVVEHFVEGLAMLTTRDEKGWRGYAEGIPEYDGDEGRVRVLVTEALERVVDEGVGKQTWRAFMHKPLGRPLSPVLATAMRIK